MTDKHRTRIEVYARLTSRKVTQTQVAEELGITKAAVNKHAGRLLRARALEEDEPGANPMFYHKGPGAAAFEADVNLSTSKRGGRLPASTWKVARVHGDGYFAPLARPELRNDIEGWQSWEIDGGRCYQAWRPIKGRRFYLRLTIGKAAASLRINPPEEWLPTKDLKKARRQRTKEANKVAEMVAAELGLRRLGGLQPKGEIEFAMPDEEGLVAPAGDAASPAPHGDLSGPNRTPEVEAKEDPTPIMELADLPETLNRFASMFKALTALADRITGLEERQEQRLEVTERTVEQLTRVVGSIEEFHHNGHNDLPPAPPDDRIEVA